MERYPGNGKIMKVSRVMAILWLQSQPRLQVALARSRVVLTAPLSCLLCADLRQVA